ncbi:MAG: TolC family protein, partial [Acidobacteriota bacterium]
MTPRWRWVAIPIAFWCLLAAPAAAQPPAAGTREAAPEALDLRSVIERALARNAGFLAALESRREVAAGIRQAAADAWPQVDLKSSWTRSRNPSLLNSPDFDDIIGQFPDFEPREEELWGLSVEVEQALYTGGKVKAAVDLAEIASSIAETRIREQRLDLALAAAEAFYDVLLAREAKQTLEAQRASRREALEVVEARYEIGEATELERLRGRASIAELGPVIAEAEGEVRVAESRLRSLLGLERDQGLEIGGPEIETAASAASPAPPEPAADFEIAGLWALAVANRPDLSDLELQIRSLERQKEVTLAEGRPQLELIGAYGRRSRLPDDLADALFD